MKHFYVYKITHKKSEGFYFGQRGCPATRKPTDDLGVFYFTSGGLKSDFQANTENYNITIVGIYPNRKLALEAESVLIHNSFSDVRCFNRAYDKVALKSAERKARFTKVKNVEPEKKISNQKKKMIQKATQIDNLVKKTLPTYFNEELGCDVIIYPGKPDRKDVRWANTKTNSSKSQR